MGLNRYDTPEAWQWSMGREKVSPGRHIAWTRTIQRPYPTSPMLKYSHIIWCAAALTFPVLGQEQAANSRQGLSFTANNEFNYDDNVLRQPDGALASRVWVFNPRIAYLLQNRGGAYRASYDVSHNRYLDSSVDTYTSQTLNLQGEQEINNFNKLTLSGIYSYNYEQRGVGFNEGSNAQLLSSPTPITTSELSGIYQLGGDEAKMRLQASAGLRNTNRDSALITNDSRDFQERMLGAMMLYRVGFRTDMVAEYRTRDILYPRTPVDTLGREIPLDSEETQYLVGVDLRATAKTTGKLRLGTIERDFKWDSAEWEDQPGVAESETPADTALPAQAPRTSGSDFYWEFAAVWAPRSYSRFEINTRSATRESLGIGSYIRSRDYMLSWTHNWSQRVESYLDLSIGTDTFKDSGRSDERKVANVRLSYDLGQSLVMGLGYRFQDLQSNLGLVGYDKSVFYIFANYRNSNAN